MSWLWLEIESTAIHSKLIFTLISLIHFSHCSAVFARKNSKALYASLFNTSSDHIKWYSAHSLHIKSNLEQPFMIVSINALFNLRWFDYRPGFSCIKHNIFIAALHILLIYILSSTLVIFQSLENLIELLSWIGTRIPNKVHCGWEIKQSFSEVPILSSYHHLSGLYQRLDSPVTTTSLQDRYKSGNAAPRYQNP